MVRRFLLLFILSVAFQQSSLRAQVSVKDSIIFTPLIGLSYGYQVPSGDLGNRFGNNSSIGCDFLFKDKLNLVYGIEGRFMFGDQVKEDGILDSITTTANFVISSDGFPAVVKFYERGWSLMGQFGKIFPVWPNKNSGVIVTLGAGYMQHKIRIDDISEQAPQLNKLYLRGYDRLSGGPCGKLSAGYFLLGNKNLLNFFALCEVYYGQTKSIRGYNYDLMSIDTKKRADILYGFRFGVMIPFYKKVPNDYYLN